MSTCVTYTKPWCNTVNFP
ncbi:hypothetical protein [Pseudoalteromonas sp.]